MFKQVLKSLSDTELIAIATEINNPCISNESIISQLAAKSNEPYFYTSEKESLMLLCLELLTEFSDRLLLVDSLQK